MRFILLCRVTSDGQILKSSLKLIQTERPNFREFCQKAANGIANSEDLDQTAPV